MDIKARDGFEPISSAGSEILPPLVIAPLTRYLCDRRADPLRESLAQAERGCISCRVFSVISLSSLNCRSTFLCFFLLFIFLLRFFPLFIFSLFLVFLLFCWRLFLIFLFIYLFTFSPFSYFFPSFWSSFSFSYSLFSFSVIHSLSFPPTFLFPSTRPSLSPPSPFPPPLCHLFLPYFSSITNFRYLDFLFVFIQEQHDLAFRSLKYPQISTGNL